MKAFARSAEARQSEQAASQTSGTAVENASEIADLTATVQTLSDAHDALQATVTAQAGTISDLSDLIDGLTTALSDLATVVGGHTTELADHETRITALEPP